MRIYGRQRTHRITIGSIPERGAETPSNGTSRRSMLNLRMPRTRYGSSVFGIATGVKDSYGEAGK